MIADSPTPTTAHAKTPRSRWLALLLPAAGAACGSDPATEIETGTQSLSFAGTSVETLEVEADGTWHIEVSDDWLSAEPASGSGDDAVDVRVDFDALSPGEHAASIAVVGDVSASVPLIARFPRVRGEVRSEGGHLAREAAAAPDPLDEPHRPNQLIVGFDRGMLSLLGHGRLDADVTAIEIEAAAMDLASAAGAREARAIAPELGIASLELEPGADLAAIIAELEAEGAVRYAEPNSLARPMDVSDPLYDLQWHYDNIGLEEAWEVSTGFEDVVVAVIDGDFHPDHPDLAGNLLPGWDFVTDSGDLYTFNSECGAHGTHVAGTVAAVTDNEIGVAGVAPDVQVIPLNVGLREEDEDPEAFPCQLDTEAIVRAVRYAAGLEDDAAGGIDEPVDVINMSLGGPPNQAWADALAFARDQGVVSIAAAGNSGGGPVGHPAAFNTTLAVSATGRDDDLAPYSSIGDEVWVAAPGGNFDQDIENGGEDPPPAGVLSTTWIYDPEPGENEDHGFGFKQGTSMASPHVAGVAALMLSANPRLDPGDVQSILAATASPPSEDAGRTPEYGYGVIDAAAAVRAARDDIEVDTEEIVVRLRAGDDVVAESTADASGAFELEGVPAGEYQLVAGDERAGEQGRAGTVLGEETVQVDYEGDLDVIVNVEPQ